MPTLLRVKPGTRFRLREAPEVTGMLIRATECRAVVRLDRPVQEVEFTDGEGRPRRFQSRGTREMSITSAVVVDVIGFEPLNNEENDMSKTRTKKTGTKGTRAKGANGKLSCIDAAAKVLSEAKEPMTTKALIARWRKRSCGPAPVGRHLRPRSTAPFCGRSARRGRTPGSRRPTAGCSRRNRT